MKSIIRVEVLGSAIDAASVACFEKDQQQMAAALHASPEAVALLAGYGQTLRDMVNRAFIVDGCVSAKEHADVLFGLFLDAITRMAAITMAAGRKVGQDDWLEELHTLEDGR